MYFLKKVLREDNFNNSFLRNCAASKNGGISAFRPKVPSNAADRKILDLMRMCWEEIPMFRPNFSTIVSVLKQANNGRFVEHLYILIIKIMTLLVYIKTKPGVNKQHKFPILHTGNQT